MTVRLESVTFTSGDGETRVPSYLATPDHDGPYPVVLILRGVAGPDDGYTEIARRLAGWGYVALVHGWKVRGADPADEPVYADLLGPVASSAGSRPTPSRGPTSDHRGRVVGSDRPRFRRLKVAFQSSVWAGRGCGSPIRTGDSRDGTQAVRARAAQLNFRSRRHTTLNSTGPKVA